MLHAGTNLLQQPLGRVMLIVVTLVFIACNGETSRATDEDFGEVLRDASTADSANEARGGMEELDSAADALEEDTVNSGSPAGSEEENAPLAGSDPAVGETEALKADSPLAGQSAPTTGITKENNDAALRPEALVREPIEPSIEESDSLVPTE